MKYILLSVMFCFALASVSAQEVYSSSGKSMSQVKRERKKKENPDGFQSSRIIFGGGLGLMIGSVTNVGISPILGYKFTDKFAAGIGLGYQYIKIKNGITVYGANGEQIAKPVVANCIYPSVWARYAFWKNLFAHGEYQHMFVNLKSYTNDFTQYPSPIIPLNESFNQPSLWLGAGVKQPLTDRVSFVILGLYNVLPDPHNIYRNPLDIRLCINAGF